jgi:hypothetical protein
LILRTLGLARLLPPPEEKFRFVVLPEDRFYARQSAGSSGGDGTPGRFAVFSEIRMTRIVPGAIATLVTTAVLFLAVPASAQIQPIDAPGTSATVSTNAWWSIGGSKWEHNAFPISSSWTGRTSARW